MDSEKFTQLLGEIQSGRTAASDELLPLVYDELRSLARGIMGRQAAAHTLQPTALANEACIRLLGSSTLSWESRAHFFAVAAVAMRQILANHARAKHADKRSAPGHRVTLAGIAHQQDDVDLLALDDALVRLAALDPRQARFIELRFFGGLTVAESAHVLAISVPTAEREWRAARAFLQSELGPRQAESGS